MGMLTMTHVPIVDQYLSDLTRSVEEAKSGAIEITEQAITYGG